MILRPHYTNWPNRWRNKNVIKVLTGMRRCGKSTVLQLFGEQLLSEGVDRSNIIIINFENMDEDYPLDAKSLYDYVVSRLSTGINYIFLNEVQCVSDFDRVVDGLYVRPDIDLYVTGSNAFFLSGEPATLLTGRYVEIQVMPLSFAEYHSADPQQNVDAAFNRYLTFGGLPYSLQIEQARDIADYLGGVFNTVIVKDIAARNPRMDMRAFSETTAFLADNIGNITSQKKIARGLTASGHKISPTTVAAYINELKSSYLVYEVGRYNIKGREHLSTLEKYYLGDLGLRFWLLGGSQQDIGHRIENAVYLELLRRADSVSVGLMQSSEIDFVTRDHEGLKYYQVAMSVLDPATLERELAPLRTVNDDYPKTLLTLDRIGVGDRNGIRQENIIDWMLGD